MTRKNQPCPLTGRNLIEFLKQLEHLTREEKALACGYYQLTDEGKKIVNLIDFFKALLDAEPEEQDSRPWFLRRGIEPSLKDRNASFILANVTLEQFVLTITQQTTQWQPQFVKKNITLHFVHTCAYQIVGQKWTILTENFFKQDSIKNLSKLWQKPIICISISDTSGCLSHSLYSCGELIEQFDGWLDVLETIPPKSPTVRYFIPEVSKESSTQGTAYFWSRHRTINPSKFKSVWDFTNSLLIEYQAYLPELSDLSSSTNQIMRAVIDIPIVSST